MKRRLTFALLFVLPLLLASCGDDSDDASAPSQDSATMATIEPAPAESPAVSKESGGLNQAPADSESTRQEVVSGSIYVTADDPVEAANKTVDKVETLAGRIDNRTEQPGTPNARARASLTVRVPADKTDELIAALHEYGKVTSVSINRSDVTMQVQDLDARINALQTSVDRLRALITTAGNLEDLLRAEDSLSSRQADLDSLLAQKRYLDDQVDLSTLSIEYTTEDVTPPNPDPEPESFWDGIVSGWNSVLDAIGAIVLFIGKAIPWVGFLAVVALVIGLAWRVIGGVRRGRRARADQTEQQERPVDTDV